MKQSQFCNDVVAFGKKKKIISSSQSVHWVLDHYHGECFQLDIEV